MEDISATELFLIVQGSGSVALMLILYSLFRLVGRLTRIVKMLEIMLLDLHRRSTYDASEDKTLRGF